MDNRLDILLAELTKAAVRLSKDPESKAERNSVDSLAYIILKEYGKTND